MPISFYPILLEINRSKDTQWIALISYNNRCTLEKQISNIATISNTSTVIIYQLRSNGYFSDSDNQFYFTPPPILQQQPLSHHSIVPGLIDSREKPSSQNDSPYPSSLGKLNISRQNSPKDSNVVQQDNGDYKANMTVLYIPSLIIGSQYMTDLISAASLKLSANVTKISPQPSNDLRFLLEGAHPSSSISYSFQSVNDKDHLDTFQRENNETPLFPANRHVAGVRNRPPVIVGSSSTGGDQVDYYPYYAYNYVNNLNSDRNSDMNGLRDREIPYKPGNLSTYPYKQNSYHHHNNQNTSNTYVSRTSILFVSISFIVLMIISLAWLVFYYVQRFRYAHAKDQLAKRLNSAAKKALVKIPLRTVKTDDKATGPDSDACAVCIEGFKPNEIVRELKCGHYFHKICVDTWLLLQRSCPICKLDILEAYGLTIDKSRRSSKQCNNGSNHHNLLVSNQSNRSSTGISFQPSLPGLRLENLHQAYRSNPASNQLSSNNNSSYFYTSPTPLPSLSSPNNNNQTNDHMVSGVGGRNFLMRLLLYGNFWSANRRNNANNNGSRNTRNDRGNNRVITRRARAGADRASTANQNFGTNFVVSLAGSKPNTHPLNHVNDIAITLSTTFDLSPNIKRDKGHAHNDSQREIDNLDSSSISRYDTPNFSDSNGSEFGIDQVLALNAKATAGGKNSKKDRFFKRGFEFTRENNLLLPSYALRSPNCTHQRLVPQPLFLPSSITGNINRDTLPSENEELPLRPENITNDNKNSSTLSSLLTSSDAFVMLHHPSRRDGSNSEGEATPNEGAERKKDKTNPNVNDATGHVMNDIRIAKKVFFDDLTPQKSFAGIANDPHLDTNQIPKTSKNSPRAKTKRDYDDDIVNQNASSRKKRILVVASPFVPMPK
ncbi:uncharacterized protein LOC135929178 [Gordionus sp. m RMFG-2023]|uniref:uncharacterized protein LOC135929178 n=1 Tax=Gordionus sp. m RMFG-2023 TaxID=3053472 RepID=UPI0031FBB139